MAEVEVTNSPTSVLQIESYLEPKIKDQIKDGDTVKSQYVQMMNILNRTTKDVLDLTTAYRVELGLTI